MKRRLVRNVLAIFACVSPALIASAVHADGSVTQQSLDERVQAFLDSRRNTWRAMNVPETDGRTLYDLIIENNYKRALEIGTSTGHSTIWIAWALSKTGGKVITIEIDEGRYRQAVKNFREAGLSDFIDARLADAHELVKELEGPFDFVFSDADKQWYTNYFIDVYPKLAVGGCYTAHNVTDGKRRRSWASGADAFYEYIKNLPHMETTLDRSGNGLSISYKRTAE